jgi:hypothetical protein
MEEVVGSIVAYDGRFLVWTKKEAGRLTSGTYDLRYIQSQIKGVTLADLKGALPKALQLEVERP